ncbi:hypothetical protein CAL29_12400 [Bordetella genomosp. 10]|uniref:Transcriptional regulator n=1 Tax=Bordetella genomosp. 10 TaxID=1416804 RepID=A0A261SAE3_9BORD|nr:hypothetical protein [Bordetella genomosp. 10]OZI34326.1 hypothetical protein CAL29_12400 [Bordetella genomosp. 10]
MSYQFKLIYNLQDASRLDNLTDELLRLLKYNGCEDVVLAWQRGDLVALAFDREAPSMDDAVAQAVQEVSRVVRVDQLVRVQAG